MVKEKVVRPVSGVLMLLVSLAGIAVAAWLFRRARCVQVRAGERGGGTSTSGGAWSRDSRRCRREGGGEAGDGARGGRRTRRRMAGEGGGAAGEGREASAIDGVGSHGVRMIT